jgi:hypothetical protein
MIGWKLGEPEQLLAAFGRILEAAESVRAREPNLRVARQTAYVARAARGLLLNRLGRYRQALPEFDAAVELAEERQRNVERAERAATVAALGDHGRATAEADALAALPDLSPPEMYNLVCVYSVSLGAVSRDETLAPAERRRRGDAYVAAALRLLRRLRAAGSRGADALRYLESDRDMAPLQARPEYQRLVKP